MNAGIFNLLEYIPKVVEAAPGAITLYKTITGSFRKRFNHHSAAVRRKAEKNMTDAAIRIKKKVDALVEAGRVTGEQVEEAMTSPAFARMLERSIIEASETASAFKHEQLASIVAARLQADAESAKALVLRKAAEMVSQLSERQLRLLGLVYAVESLEPEPIEGSLQEQVDDAVASIDLILNPFDGLEITYHDVAHLDGLGLLHFSPHVGQGHWSGHEQGQAKVFQFIGRNFGAPISPTNPEPYHRLDKLMHWDRETGRPGLEAIKTKPVGWVLGMCVYCQVAGHTFDISWP